MIGKLQGRIVEQEQNHLILDVQGVGYEIYIPSCQRYAFPSSEETLALYTHLLVRENLMELYGFLTQADRELFRLLITISRLGPKIGIKILETFSPHEFYTVIANGDEKALKQISGLGGKLAESVLIECKSKLKKIQQLVIQDSDSAKTSKTDLNKRNEAMAGLEAMGYSDREALNVVSMILKKQPELSVEEIIHQALQEHQVE